MAGTARGRPARTPEQIAEMRAHIASCALDLFHAEGYVGISMRRLASEAGCTPMTLYKYFENKFEILGTLWAGVLGELFDRLDGVAAASSDPEQRLTAVANGYVEFWLEHRDHYYLVFMSGGITQEDVSRFMGDEAVLTRFDLFRSCIADLLAPSATPDDIEVKAEVLVCGLNGIAQALITLSGYPWADATALVQALTSGLLDR
ncbi:MAG: TetR/AcrR family transcriptional regulator [Acidimicrobiales bacterium]|nr:TetR/AcrR family transcriptional regulator [Acidimicrobiales bacterium]